MERAKLLLLKRNIAALIAALAFIAGCLYVWQLTVDPRRSEETFVREMLGVVSRGIVGEHCISRYMISERPEAIGRAKDIMMNHARTWIMVGNGRQYDAVFNSAAFKDGDDGAWKVGKADRKKTWSVSFSLENEELRADLVVEMSLCGRITNHLQLLAGGVASCSGRDCPERR